MKKRGQLQISFGMIFSIILIVAFIAVGIYAITIFLNLKKCAETGMFKQELQEEIGKAWNSEESSFVKSFILPAEIKEVCFVDFSSGKKGSGRNYYDEAVKYAEESNMFFWPLKASCETGFSLKHANLTEITKEDNPYCIKNVNGKVELKIEKGFYESEARVS